MERVDFALVWEEEQEILYNLAASVPDNGIIVEIGTALGGTGTIFHQASHLKNVKIYTLDTIPFSKAAHHLNGLDIVIINKPSTEYAHRWTQAVNKPIDLLFIDGDHSFKGVFEDYNSWISHMRPGGTVVFHDYDPITRAGLVHLGVRVCLDTIIEHQLLDDMKHDYKLLHGKANLEHSFPLNIGDCFQTFDQIGVKIIEIRGKIFSGSIVTGIRAIQERTFAFDSLQACYCIDYALKKDFECLDHLAHSFHDFRRWAETLSVFEHAYGVSPFPNMAHAIPMPEDVDGLSRLIAQEQLRITLLSQILKAIVKWSP